MNTAFPEVIAGTTTSLVSPFVINGTLPYAGNPNTYLADEYKGTYIIRYGDNVTTGFECGYGIYDTATDTITTIAVFISSDGDGVACSTFTSAAKHIGFTLAGSEFGNMARVFAPLQPHEDILAGFTSQSNGSSAVAFYTGAGPADTTRVKDWSRIAANTGSPAWRNVVKADQYTYEATNPHLGTSRSRLDGTWKKTGSIIHSFATQVALLMGRTVRTVVVTRGATSFNEPTYGWGYLPSVATTISKVFKDAVDAAITQLHIDDPTQTTVTKLHVYFLVQGESDAIINDEDTPYFTVPSNKYGFLLADHLRALEDPARWNIANSNTIYLLADIPTPIRTVRGHQASGGNEFDGHAQAAAIFGPRAIVIPTAGLAVRPDSIHYTGEGADALGARAANLLLSNTTVDGNTGGAFRLTKNNTYPDPAYVFRADSASVPASQDILWNVGRTLLKIHYTANIGDMSLQGLGLFQVGDVLRIEKSSDAGIYVDSTITALATDNTTYFSYACTSVSVGTLVAADTVLIKPQNCAFHDGKSYTAATAHNILSSKQNLVNRDTGYSLGFAFTAGADVYRNHHVVMANEQGRQYRSRKLGTRYGALRTTAVATNTTILNFSGFEAGRYEYIKATVLYKTSAGLIGLWSGEAIISRVVNAAVLEWSTTPAFTVNEEALATLPNIAVSTFAGLGAIEGYLVRVTGKAATTIDWVCEVETIVIPTSA